MNMQPEHHSTPTRPRSGTRSTDDRSLADLFRELTRETRRLIRQELRLAKTEASEKLSEAGKDAGFVGAGGAIAYAGFIVLTVGLALLLGTLMPNWLAFVIVGALVAAIGFGLVQSGRKRLQHTDFTLARTVETLEEDKQWMKDEVREMREGDHQSTATSTQRGR